jgi:hypothetical protein
LYFHITQDSTELVDPQTLTSFHATCSAGLSAEDLAAVVRRTGLGDVLPDGEHLMVRIDAVRRMAADHVDPGWSADFDRMIAYAGGKGWLSEDGTHVRAHVERT